MSFTAPTQNGGSQSLATTSTNTLSAYPSSYHPQPRPPPVPMLERTDMHSLKQDLHDALGEHGLAYWKALNGYLLGQVGRSELVEMVKGWIKGKKVLLHNRLLVSLLSNSSLPASSQALNGLNRKRKRVSYDHPDYDADEAVIELRDRVAHWAAGMSPSERARLRKAVLDREEIDAEVSEDAAAKKRWSPFNAGAGQSISLLSRHLPSSNQLTQRLAVAAKASGLTIAPDASLDVGEFMAVGMDAHLSDTLHSIVHLTAKGRPGDETIRLPGGLQHLAAAGSRLQDYAVVNGHADPTSSEAGNSGEPRDAGRSKDMPRPDLQTFQYLFELNPTLHPQESPTIYKLKNSHSLVEAELSHPHSAPRQYPVPSSPLTMNGNALVNGGDATGANGSASHATASTTPARMPPQLTPIPGATSRFGAGPHKAEIVAKELLDNGLLKLDKTGRQGDGADGEAAGRKDRKHNLHWKYEDPAVILKDILG